VPAGAPQLIAKIDRNGKRISASTFPILVDEVPPLGMAGKEIGVNVIMLVETSFCASFGPETSWRRITGRRIRPALKNREKITLAAGTLFISILASCLSLSWILSDVAVNSLIARMFCRL
jgi:hypothetical protein